MSTLRWVGLWITLTVALGIASIKQFPDKTDALIARIKANSSQKLLNQTPPSNIPETLPPQGVPPTSNGSLEQLEQGVSKFRESVKIPENHTIRLQWRLPDNRYFVISNILTSKSNSGDLYLSDGTRQKIKILASRWGSFLVRIPGVWILNDLHGDFAEDKNPDVSQIYNDPDEEFKIYNRAYDQWLLKPFNVVRMSK